MAHRRVKVSAGAVLVTAWLWWQSFASLNIVESLAIEENNVVVAGFLSDDHYNRGVNVNGAGLHLTDMVIHSARPRDDGTIHVSEMQNLAMARDARAYKKKNSPESESLRILLTIGGLQGRSEAFSTIASNKDARENFWKQMKILCQTEALDGIDMEIEDLQNLRTTIVALDNFLVETAKIVHQELGLLFTMTLPVGTVLPQQIYQVLDRVHLQTQDLTYVPHLKNKKKPANIKAVTEFVENLVDSGLEPWKVIVGIPAFGRSKEAPRGTKSYAELVAAYEREHQSSALATLAVFLDTDTIQNHVFDSPHQVQDKVKYVVNEELGGVFLWDIFQDKQHGDLAPGGILVDAMSRAVEAAIAQQKRDNMGDEL